MKRITIIPDDNAVYVDGEARTVDCSGIAADVQAVQWFPEKGEGWVERRDDMGRIWGNQPLKSFDAYQHYVQAWEAKGGAAA